jgi:flagellar biosynthesis/type III secretory pathway protein FliH
MTDIRIPFNRSPDRVRLVILAPDGRVPLTEVDQLKQLLGGLNVAIQDLQRQQSQSIQELQHVAIELATAAAAWLTQASIDRGQFNLQQLIESSVEQLGGDSSIAVRLNPQDHELWTQLQKENGVTAETLTELEYVSDASLARGSCTTESQNISLVTDIETRLASVRQAWLENLDDAQTERRATGRDGWEPGRVPDRRETA